MNEIVCSDVFEYLKTIKNESIDLIIADPPYGQCVAEWDRFVDRMDYLSFMRWWIINAVLKLKNTGSMYIFNNAYNSTFIVDWLKGDAQLQNWIIWYKKDGFAPTKKRYVNNQETVLFFTKSDNYTFNYDDIRTPYTTPKRIVTKNGKKWYPNDKGKLCTDVWEFASERHNKKVNGKTQKLSHPTPKPEALIERIIRASSNENDIVMDLFSGSGTTAYVAQKLNRQFTGCENNEQYFELIQERLGKVNI